MVHIYIASDHAGLEGKEKAKEFLEKLDCTYEDLGPNTYNKDDDYPYYAKYLSNKVKESENSLGILVCGSGVGVAMAANKVKGIRAVQGYDTYTAQMARLDENANVLTLRSREFDLNNYYDIIKTFIQTEFREEDRHKRRIKELEDIRNSLE